MIRQTIIKAAARSSPLSKIQVQEILQELNQYYPFIKFDTTFLKTTGDLDKKTSLRQLNKTNFFTKEIDEYQIKGNCQISIHSAKDLPNPIDKRLTIAAITKGLDPSDSLVLREGQTIDNLPKNSTIATSSQRREETVKKIRPDLKFVDIRGNIEKRLAQLNDEKIDGLVIAEAALIRLKLTHLNRIKLPGKTVEGQGQLAILTNRNDVEMQKIFTPLDSRIKKPKAIYFGLDPNNYKTKDLLFHYPIIEIIPKKQKISNLQNFTHIIFTSKSAVKIFFDLLKGQKASQKIIAIGKETAKSVENFGHSVYLTAKNETSEGIVEELKKIDLSNVNILWPHSAKSRDIVTSFLKNQDIKYQDIEIYDTITHKNSTKPTLKYFNKLIFTSPSTINAFLEIFGPIPKNKEVETIGSVTQSHLTSISPM